MKITAGLGSIDDYIPYVKAGADELFCGYVPSDWVEKYGMSQPLNRREVCYYNVQIGSAGELAILRRMMDRYHVPVAITLNSLSYTPEQYPLIEDYMLRLAKRGFDRFIIADPALLYLLHKDGLSKRFHIHVSGEFGNFSVPVLEELKRQSAERIIFHRKVSLKDMKEMTAACPGLEYEAFIMNERCHFHGGFCNSMHCDEFAHMCLVSYRLGQMQPGAAEKSPDIEKPDVFYEGLGATGCGLCALWQLRDAGVAYLKVVSRGGYSGETAETIAALRRALEILNESPAEAEYRKKILSELFPEGCGHKCYYQEY